MTDIEKACEAYECAAIVAANIIANNPTLNLQSTDVTAIINDLRNTMKKYIGNSYGNFQINSSIKKTDWEQYRKNANEFIDLAKRLSGQ